ncbi:phosphoribosylaminoimidazolecarboxamide formyltransferase [Myxococcota bacterium]
MTTREIKLRYGMNPHQLNARVMVEQGGLPIRVANGAPGFINLCDALNAWQLVKELKAATGLAAAASFKHVSPAGAAVAVPLSSELLQLAGVEGQELSPLGCAYARARGADPMSSFGDLAAFSEPVDESAALLLKPEVSDGAIAPGYAPRALEILRGKKGGKFLLLEMDPCYEPPELERRQIFGVTLEQTRNAQAVTAQILADIRTRNRVFPADAKRDLLVATITLKYTQSNSVCYAAEGQAIGVGAGQQSRVHCVRLAGDKADRWMLRRHPRVLGMKFKAGLKRPEKNTAVELYLSGRLSPGERAQLDAALNQKVEPLSEEERSSFVQQHLAISLSSDAFFPFRDNIDRAAVSGVKYIVQPGGSVRDEDVIAAADEHGMVMAFSGLRWFHH